MSFFSQKKEVVIEQSTELSFQEVFDRCVNRFETSFRELSNGRFEGKFDNKVETMTANREGKKSCTAIHVTFKITAK